jgi:hypothetical protein
MKTLKYKIKIDAELDVPDDLSLIHLDRYLNGIVQHFVEKDLTGFSLAKLEKGNFSVKRIEENTKTA